MPKGSQYDRMTALTGAERLLGIQGTATEIVTLSEIATFAAVEAGAVTLDAVEGLVAPKADAAELADATGAAMVGFQAGGEATPRRLDEKVGEIVSVMDYLQTADGENFTPAITRAIAALPAIGGRIMFPANQKYACNIVITKPNITFEAQSRGGGTSGPQREFGLVPWDPALPVLQIADGTATVAGFTATDMNIWRAGPNGEGDYGLRLHGGTLHAAFNNFRCHGFNKKSVWIENSATQPISYVYFNNYVFGVSTAASVEHALLIRQVGSAYTTAIYFSNGAIGTGLAGHPVEIDNTFADFTNTWIEGAHERSVKLSNGAYMLGCNVHMDSGSSSDVLIEVANNSAKVPSDFLRGIISVDGMIRFADGSLAPIHGDVAFLRSPSMFDPHFSGSLYVTETTDTTKRDMRLYRAADALYVESPGTLRLNPTGNGVGMHAGVSRWMWNDAGLRPQVDDAYDMGAAGGRWRRVYGARFMLGSTSGSPFVTGGAGSPEGAVTAPVGSMYARSDGGAGSTLYVKESGSGTTGWVAK